MPAQMNPKCLNQDSFFFLPLKNNKLGWMQLMFMCVLGCYVASTVLPVPKFLEGIDCVRKQMWGDKECPFSDVTNSGRI